MKETVNISGLTQCKDIKLNNQMPNQHLLDVYQPRQAKHMNKEFLENINQLIFPSTSSFRDKSQTS